MHVLQGLKRLLQFVFDADTYCLLSVAVQNRFRRPGLASSDPATPDKKQAKAVNAR